MNRVAVTPALGAQGGWRKAGVLSLPGFKARVFLVDDVNPATPTDDATVLVPLFGRFKRINDFHVSILGATATLVSRDAGKARKIGNGTEGVNSRREFYQSDIIRSVSFLSA